MSGRHCRSDKTWTKAATFDAGGRHRRTVRLNITSIFSRIGHGRIRVRKSTEGGGVRPFSPVHFLARPLLMFLFRSFLYLHILGNFVSCLGFITFELVRTSFNYLGYFSQR